MFNFALWLSIASFVFGAIYAMDVVFWSKKRTPEQVMPKIVEYARELFPVVFTVLILRSFVMEPFRIPSGSLEPTLLVGDFLVVNKFAYGLRLPIWEKKILSVGHPKTGDIAIFRWPPKPTDDFIKRVIGVPGDKISYHNKVLRINNEVAQQTFIRYTTDPSSGNPVALYQENLNGVKHFIFRRTDVPAVDFDVTVPPHQYFMMGDNRDDSADSRFWGFVDDQYLRGKALLIWLSWNSKTSSLRWNRFGQFIH